MFVAGATAVLTALPFQPSVHGGALRGGAGTRRALRGVHCQVQVYDVPGAALCGGRTDRDGANAAAFDRYAAAGRAAPLGRTPSRGKHARSGGPRRGGEETAQAHQK